MRLHGWRPTIPSIMRPMRILSPRSVLVGVALLSSACSLLKKDNAQSDGGAATATTSSAATTTATAATDPAPPNATMSALTPAGTPTAVDPSQPSLPSLSQVDAGALLALLDGAAPALPATDAATPAAGGLPAACDQWMSKMQACIAKGDANTRAILEAALAGNRAAWTKMSSDPNARAGLVVTCGQILSTPNALCP